MRTREELYKKVDFKENLKLYLEIAKPYKWFFFFVIFLVLIHELLSVSEKYLFSFLIDKGTNYVAGKLDLPSLNYFLMIVGGIYVGIFVVRSVEHWFRMGIVNKMESKMIFDLKKKYFDHIVQLSHSFHSTHKTGSLISKLNRGGSALERLTDFLVFEVSPLVMQVIIVGISLFVLDWITAVVILATCLAFILYGLYISEIQKPAHAAANDAEDREKGTISDVFANIDSIKYFGKEEVIQQRYVEIAEDVRVKRLKFWDYGKVFGSGQIIILGIGTILLLYFSLQKFLAGGITVGNLAFIYTVYVGLMGPLWGFVHGIRGFYISLGDFDALFKYGKIKNEIEDVENAPEMEIKEGQIEFKNVSFGYSGRGKGSLIKSLSLKIKSNEKVALVGHSGCGKTTLVKLLYRFYDVDSGEVLIDGKNIMDVKQKSLRSELSIVPQEAILFDDTIYNNIAFSNLLATREEVMNAIKFAQLDKFVENLPLKENTIVGERGVKLSGGERQRVSIARAILANKKVLVLDEATSSLDSKTEFEIQKDLWRLMQGRTAIIIAHRLSTVMRADRIIVMDKGKIVQIGKHRELIKKRGLYKELWNLQKGGYLGE